MGELAGQLQQIASRVRGLEDMRRKDAEALAHYSMLVQALAAVTTLLSDAYWGDDQDFETAAAYGIPEAIGLAAAVLKEASPPHAKMATDLMTQWAKPCASRKGRRKK